MPKFKPPASEQGMTQCNDINGKEVGHVTRKITEPTKHCLYMIVDGVWRKIAISENPYNLYDIVWGDKNNYRVRVDYKGTRYEIRNLPSEFAARLIKYSLEIELRENNSIEKTNGYAKCISKMYPNESTNVVNIDNKTNKGETEISKEILTILRGKLLDS